MIIFEDQNLIAVNKPSGLLAVAGRGEDKQDSVETRIKAIYKTAAAIHRLDMETSGLMLIAKHKEAERFYKICFEKRQVFKKYIAVVKGEFGENEGILDFPLIADWANRPRQKVDFENGKASLTRFQVLETSQKQSRLALFPITGRTHQLRVHLSYINYPILGDSLYSQDSTLYPRLYLHCQQLAIPNLNGGEFYFFVKEEF